jgi:hypothetical protein
MSWEHRKGHRRYYTRSRRMGGRIVREYLGCGQFAELTARSDEHAREVRTIAAKEEAERRFETIALSAELDRICQLSDCLSRAVLLAAGYHEHRGNWRRRRGKTKEN